MHDSAHIHHWSGNGTGALDHHGRPGGGAPGFPGHDTFATNPQAKADIQTLQTDIKALQAEVPAALQTQLKADKATIDQALSTLTPTQRHDLHKTPPSDPTSPPSDPTAFLTTQLKAANVSDAQISQIVNDFQTYQTTLQTVDPTLSAKITADQAAVAKDLPAGHHAASGRHPGFPHGARFLIADGSVDRSAPPTPQSPPMQGWGARPTDTDARTCNQGPRWSSPERALVPPTDVSELEAWGEAAPEWSVRH